MIPPPPCAVHAGQEADRRPGPATSTTPDGRRTRPPSSPHPLRAPLMRLTRRDRPISRNTPPGPASGGARDRARTGLVLHLGARPDPRLVLHLGGRVEPPRAPPRGPRRAASSAAAESTSGRPRRRVCLRAPVGGGPPAPLGSASAAAFGAARRSCPAIPRVSAPRSPMPATGDHQCRHRGPPGAIPTGESHRVCPPRQVARRPRSCPAHRAFTRRRHPARRERHPPDPAGPADALPRHDPAVPGAWKPNGSGHGSRPTRGTHPGHRRRGRRAFTLQCGADCS
jgi:hypothetical protein